MDTATKRYIESRATEAPDTFGRLAHFYERRLWHQLTQELVAVLESWPTGASPQPQPQQQQQLLLELYRQFIRDFEGRLNPVSLVQIVLGISRIAFAGDASGAIAFLHEAIGDGKPHVASSAPATLLYLSELIRLNLRGASSAAAADAAAPADGAQASLEQRPLREARQLRERAACIAESASSAAGDIDASVLSAYYRALSEYYKLQGPASDYFRSALAFLSYTPFEALQREEQIQWALDVSLAALIGEDIYNFGEVLAHEVVQALADVDGYAWLYAMLVAFRRGDIAEYERLCRDETVAAAMRQHAVLAANADFLQQKIRMLRLMELAAFEHTHDRRIPFDEVARECHVGADEVEFVLMKALALGLIGGSIDEVARAVTVTRVMPRVMDRADAHQMARRLTVWDESVSSMLRFVQRESGDMLVGS